MKVTKRQWWPPVLEMIRSWQHQPQPCKITSRMGDTSCIPPGLCEVYCFFFNLLVSDISETYDWLITGYKLIIDLKKSSFTTSLLICILFMTHWSTDIQLPEIWEFIREFIVPGPSQFRIPKFSGPVNITS